MKSTSSITKAKNEFPRGFIEIWHLKLNDPSSHRALWLRFVVLKSLNGFKKVAEVWGIYFHKTNGKEIKKVAIKQNFDFSDFSSPSAKEVKIANCQLLGNRTFGAIQAKGQSIEWNLDFVNGQDASFAFVPRVLSKSKLIKTSIITDHEELFFTGKTKINGEVIEWDRASGMLGRIQGPRIGHSWVWSQCNTFFDEQGKAADLIFEGLTTQTKLGPLTSPRISSFYFNYKNESYCFNTLKDAFFIKSKNTLKEWEFRAERKDISFRGYAKAEHKEFAGLTYEDTDGSLLYCSNSKLSDLRIIVYKKGKLEATFTAKETAAFEIVSRTKNPYVPLLI